MTVKPETRMKVNKTYVVERGVSGAGAMVQAITCMQHMC